MSETIQAGDLSKVLGDILTEYTDEVLEKVKESVQETAKEAKKELKVAGAFKNRTGVYRRSWKVSFTGGRLFASAVIYQDSDEYRLTHLLEFGHAKAGGGRVKAFPHLADTQKNADALLQEKIKKKVEDIS